MFDLHFLTGESPEKKRKQQKWIENELFKPSGSLNGISPIFLEKPFWTKIYNFFATDWRTRNRLGGERRRGRSINRRPNSNLSRLLSSNPHQWSSQLPSKSSNSCQLLLQIVSCKRLRYNILDDIIHSFCRSSCRLANSLPLCPLIHSLKYCVSHSTGSQGVEVKTISAPLPVVQALRITLPSLLSIRQNPAIPVGERGASWPGGRLPLFLLKIQFLS